MATPKTFAEIIAATDLSKPVTQDVMQMLLLALADLTEKLPVPAMVLRETVTLQPNAQGEITWVYSKEFNAVPSLVFIEANTPTGAAYINVAGVIDGSITNKQAKAVVKQLPNSFKLVSLVLNAVIGLLTPPSGPITLRCFAYAPQTASST